MRLFLAFHVTDEQRTALAAAQKRLAETDVPARWSAPEGFHLTVKFIGDVEAGQLPDIEETCEWLAGQGAAFRFRLRGLSTFPKRGPLIKVVWAGLAEGQDGWRSLAERAQEAFAPFGVPQESSLVPHVTLGRIRAETELEDLRAAIARENETEFGEAVAGHLTLVQSHLNPDGAIYEDLRQWSLT